MKPWHPTRLELVIERLQGKTRTLNIVTMDGTSVPVRLAARIGRFVIHRSYSAATENKWIITHEPSTKIAAVARTFTAAVRYTQELDAMDHPFGDGRAWDLSQPDDSTIPKGLIAAYKAFKTRIDLYNNQPIALPIDTEPF